MSGYTDLTKLETSRNCLRRIARHDEQQFSKDSIVNVMEKFVKTVNIMDDTILVPCRLMDRQIGDSSDIIPATGKDTTANQLTQSSSAQGKRGAAQSKNVQDFLNASELFNLYNMLNALKNDLLWTAKQADEGDETEQLSGKMPTLAEAETKTESSSTSSGNRNNGGSTAAKGHVRRTSTASMASTTSVSNMSDSDSDISNENDSGLESDGNKSDNAQSSDVSSSASSSSSDIEECKSKSKQASGDKATELAKRCRRHLNGLYQCLEQMTEAANYLTARYQSDIGPV
ncbi:suppressor protein SRP40 [Scaptodrosophila lebanonensis]|uniref:Suppressor protein SRP40 n=1 Tax=Drosophila lebanonensis TaxID=7225 RepID=A0A6J2U231_DROLE|nr:suppressor protein SRP40 [Scaptodrosophila lebanonensis]